MDKIISELRYLNKKFPREQLKKASERKSEITPILLQELDRVIESPEIATEDRDYMLHLYAIYLLAEFREKKAFAKIINLIELTPDEVENMLGDTITERLSSILYSTFDGQVSMLQSVIDNPLIDIYVRGATLDTYAKLYSDGLVSRDELIDYLRELIYCSDYDEEEILGTNIQGVVVDYNIYEMVDDIQFLYDENYIDEFMFGKYDSFIDSVFSYKDQSSSVRYINSAIEEMNWWACFEKTKEEKLKKKKNMEELAKEIKRREQRENKARKKTKIGRNDPCPCGSGKKYKRCCIDKDIRSGEEGIIESPEEIKRWLKYYPSEDKENSDNEVLITDVFDKESIDIDKLVYLALHHRAIPIWVDRDRKKEDKIKISYLIKASEKFVSKCEREDISSFEQYDEEYKIHYRSGEWHGELVGLIKDNGMENEIDLRGVEEILYRFS